MAFIGNRWFRYAEIHLTSCCVNFWWW